MENELRQAPRIMNPRPLPNLRWWIIGLLCLATTINYIDRQAMSVAAPVITKEYKLSATDYSWILFWFLLAYAVMQAVAGKLFDRIGTKRGFTLSIIWWSIANMLTAFGSGVTSFSFFRGLLGVGEAGNYPAALKAIAEWFPKAERSNAVGILNAGPGLGSIIAPPLIASWLIPTYGWRAAFVVTGALGLLWLFAWQWLYYKPEEHPKITKQEWALIQSERASQSSTKTPWLQFLRHKEVWGLMLSRFVCDGVFYFFAFWLPQYLSNVRGFNLKQIGASAWIPYLAADLGSIFGGWLGGHLIARGMSLNASRKWMIWLGAAVVPVAMLVNSTQNAYVALSLIAVVMFAVQIKSSSLFAVPADIARPQDVATVWGLSGAAGSLGGMLFQLTVGWLVDHISYAPVFVLVSGMHIASALLVMWLIPRIEPLAER
jgi:ACS family hexuronate transporter-like MFS transporter